MSELDASQGVERRRVELDDRVGVRDLPTTTGLTAYRVIQEALTNAGRYGTGTVRVVLLAAAVAGGALPDRSHVRLLLKA